MDVLLRCVCILLLVRLVYVEMVTKKIPTQKCGNYFVVIFIPTQKWYKKICITNLTFYRYFSLNTKK